MPARPLNPFIWSDAVAASDAVSRQPFTGRIAKTLRAGTHVALFGPRGTGKSSFLLELNLALAREEDQSSPAWAAVTVDLRTAISVPAFIAAVGRALDDHPDRGLRRRASSAMKGVEKELGVNLGVIKAGIRSRGRSEVNEEVVLHAQLVALSKLADRVVIEFDEFQRLNSCPGNPLSQIRSALMGPRNAGHVSLLFTGSLRERLALMLKTDSEPIWDQTLDEELPDLDFEAFVDYLQLRFEATAKPISDRAAEHLVDLGGAHPKRTQQLAWHIWDQTADGGDVDIDAVDLAYERLLRSQDQVAQTVDGLLNGGESEVSEAKALFLISGGGSPGSRALAKRYGLADESAAARALERLSARGVAVATADGWRVVDPLLAEWLRRRDPLAIEG